MTAADERAARFYGDNLIVDPTKGRTISAPRASYSWPLHPTAEQPQAATNAATYLRFSAEAEPETTLRLPPEPLRGLLLPRRPDTATDLERAAIDDTSYPTTDQGVADATGMKERAYRAWHDGNFGEADTLFDELKKTVEYSDVSALVHGKTNWRMAQKAVTESERRAAIGKAKELLDRAASHKDPRYRAEALYRHSKVDWQQWYRARKDVSPLRLAKDKAAEALRVLYRGEYLNWYNKVDADLVDALRDQDQTTEMSQPPIAGAGGVENTP